MVDRLLRIGALAGAGALLLSACSFAPAYSPPKLAASLPTSFKETGPWTPAAPADGAPRGAWWTIFGDGTLNDLEGRIETGNPDLAAALARYDQARALLGQARASLFPAVNFDGYSDRVRQSDVKPLRGTAPAYYTDNVLGGEIAYEFDFWGRIRNTVKAQKGLAQASAADLAAARLSLQAQLAQAYLSMRALDAEARVLADATATYQRALDLTQKRFDDGVATGLDVGRARTQLETARTQETTTLASRALYEHAVASLIGQPASTFSLAVDEQAFPAPPAVPVTAASDLLQRRPDVAAAERRAYAANARIGVARAAFFPTISLNALGGFEAANGLNIAASGASFWTLGPEAILPLFDAGRRHAVERQARAEFDETSATYRSTVLTAFQQVEDNLALCNRLAEAAQSEAAAAEAADKTEVIATKQYRDGATTYLDVVTAQTAALDARRAMINLNAQRLQAAVALIRALGGGWTASADMAG
jgi:NodT family efflux transporter outer membrane factor (OMF) lipoprotein